MPVKRPTAATEAKMAIWNIFPGDTVHLRKKVCDQEGASMHITRKVARIDDDKATLDGPIIGFRMWGLDQLVVVKNAGARVRTPKAVLRWLRDFEETEQGLRQYVDAQRAIWESLPLKHTDFTGWMCLKLSCNPATARIIYRWATGKRVV